MINWISDLHKPVVIYSGAQLIYLCTFLSFLMCPCNNKSVIGMKTQVKESVVRMEMNLVGFYFGDQRVYLLNIIFFHQYITKYVGSLQKKFKKSLLILTANYHKESISLQSKSNLAKCFRIQKEIEAFLNFFLESISRIYLNW